MNHFVPVFFCSTPKCEMIARWFGAITVGMDNYHFKLRPNHIPIIRGMWDSHIERMRYFDNHGIDYLTVDNGYFFRNPHGTGYYRITWNQMQQNFVRKVDTDRLTVLYAKGLKILDWHKYDDGYIVLCPPTPQPSKLYGLENWTELTYKAICNLTDREIRIREKPKGESLTTENFQEFIKEAYCTVTYNSIAAIESVIAGCPALVHTSSAAAPVCSTSLFSINNPITGINRTPWLASLAYGQFNATEIYNGIALREMIKIKPTRKQNAEQNNNRMGST